MQTKPNLLRLVCGALMIASVPIVRARLQRRQFDAWNDIWANQIARQMQPFTAGITVQDVDVAAKHGDLRIVIKQNALYVGPARTEGLEASHSDHAVVMMIAKALCYRNVSDVDMVLNLDDFPLFRSNESTQSFPIMSWSKSEAFNDIHFPYWSFTWLPPVPSSVQGLEWTHKKKIAIWRGSTTGGAWTEMNWRNQTRAKLSSKCNARPDLCDAKITGYVQGADAIRGVIENDLGKAPRMELEEICSYRYVIVVDGNGPASSRLLTLLRNCKSLLLVQETQFKLFWMAGFQPFVHYVPLAENLEDLYDRIQWVRNNDDAAHRIASNAHDFARHYFTDDFVVRYMTTLFEKYAALLKFQVHVGKQMIQVPVATKAWEEFYNYMGGRCRHFGSMPTT